MNNLMVSIIKDRQIDNPQGLDETYFDNLDNARIKGVELIDRYNAECFVVRKLTTGRGHYRTLGYFSKDNQYIR